MRITFYGEHRSTFTAAEGAVKELGDFEVREALIADKWRESSDVRVDFVAPQTWVQYILYPGSRPASQETGESKARYFTIRRQDNTLETFICKDFTSENLDDETSLVQINGVDPRHWLHTMPGVPLDNPPENWTGRRVELLRRASDRTSAFGAAGQLSWQRLPVRNLVPDRSPNTSEQDAGIVRPDRAQPGGSITVANPDPLPPVETVEEILSTWDAVELYPLDVFGDAGSPNSPMWEWTVREKVYNGNLFSEHAGNLKIKGVSGSWEDTEAMAYADDTRQSSFSTGDNISRSRLGNAWASIKVERVNVPDGATEAAFLKSKALAESKRLMRMGSELELRLPEDTRFYPGTQFNVRFGERIYIAPADEIVSHYSREHGWSATATTFISVDTVELDEPVEPERDIIFTATGDPVTGQFRIPTYFSGGEAPYSWRVFLDGRVYGVFEGSGHFESSGILIQMTGEEHEITLQPSDGEYIAGWGRAFGFWSSNTTHARSILQVKNDPDYAHLLTDDDTGDYYRAHQFRSCENITMIPQENLPGTVRRIGNYFRYYQYYDSMVVRTYKRGGPTKAPVAPVEELINEGPVSIGNYFRAHQYDMNPTGSVMPQQPAVSGARESIPDSVKMVGDYFRSNQYNGAGDLVRTGLEHAGSGVEQIGSYYRHRQYFNSNVGEALQESDPPVPHIPNYFRYQQYRSASRLVIPADEDSRSFSSCGDYYRADQYYQSGVSYAPEEKSTFNQIIGSNFRRFQFCRCSSLINLLGEENIGNPSAIGSNFRVNQFDRCGNVTVARDEVMPDSVVSVGSGYRQQQYGYTGVRISAREDVSSNLVGSFLSYRTSMYTNCTDLHTALPEVPLPEGVTRINGGWNQFYSCTSLTTAAVEADLPSTVVTIEDRHRYRQYYGCTSPFHAPEEADESSVKTIASGSGGYRTEQYRNSGVIDIARETNHSNLTELGVSYRVRQYNNCKSITNSRGYSETYIPVDTFVHNSTTSASEGGFRQEQFKDSGIMIPLAENHNPDLTVSGTRVRSESFRGSQYEGCLDLQTIPAEVPVSGISGNAYRYRQSQFEGCLSADTSGHTIQNINDMSSGTSNYRNRQFALTQATAANPIHYYDGSPVIEGQDNIPTSFYTD